MSDYAPKRRGYYDPAISFLGRFCPALLHDSSASVDHVLISSLQFDEWADKNGFYGGVDMQNKAALNAARNLLRNGMNSVMMRKVWFNQSYPPMQIRVASVPKPKKGSIHSMYQLVKPITGFLTEGKDFSKKMNRTFGTRKRQLSQLCSVTIDQIILNPAANELEKQQERNFLSSARQIMLNIQSTKERFEFDLKILERDFDGLRDQAFNMNTKNAEILRLALADPDDEDEPDPFS